MILVIDYLDKAVVIFPRNEFLDRATAGLFLGVKALFCFPLLLTPVGIQKVNPCAHWENNITDSVRFFRCTLYSAAGPNS